MDPATIAAVATAGIALAQAAGPASTKAYRYLRDLDIRDDIDEGMEQMDQLIDGIEDCTMTNDIRSILVKWLSMVKVYRFDQYQLNKLDMLKDKIEMKLEQMGEAKYVNGEFVCTGNACHLYKAQRGKADKHETLRDSWGKGAGRSKR
mmetsp:Transcript_16432/g.18932  ORF Transcript_16432/g.18932 Transcript_16432/m.18932 type:complete len:148 (-) Transcript_16432:229-672(-)|eukprot:CAMPEP_0194145720 /NCGR_PEP_ID=MMETSP0152-20130528/18682_1 /TAXON_ID=1049557 /ORGANISM="Thalassiothrix antarctica, Strain L6-D1" /LENGTH=147 /DNA_ID=CAMNT_0038846039 /DNA_START=131 /DNA_END=574 /DNA_ORIENTATION=+